MGNVLDVRLSAPHAMQGDELDHVRLGQERPAHCSAQGRGLQNQPRTDPIPGSSGKLCIFNDYIRLCLIWNTQALLLLAVGSHACPKRTFSAFQNPTNKALLKPKVPLLYQS